MSINFIPPAVAGQGNINTRQLLDPNFIGQINPSSGQTVSGTTVFDLSQASPWPVTERILAFITATGTFSTAGTISVQWQDSADNVTFANIGEMGASAISSSNYYPASAAYLWTNGTNYIDRWQFPPSVRRYVKVTVTASSSFSLGSGAVQYGLFF